mmetsp:Transcript_60053/g.196031  ORF Transcript_60053/g.196031 Transcript_60053/m.196031 type:complete len:207 (-) Transcript_60053:1445-2065(-)
MRASILDICHRRHGSFLLSTRVRSEDSMSEAAAEHLSRLEAQKTKAQAHVLRVRNVHARPGKIGASKTRRGRHSANQKSTNLRFGPTREAIFKSPRATKDSHTKGAPRSRGSTMAGQRQAATNIASAVAKQRCRRRCAFAAACRSPVLLQGGAVSSRIARMSTLRVTGCRKRPPIGDGTRLSCASASELPRPVEACSARMRAAGGS